jgi:hypothetical protein
MTQQPRSAAVGTIVLFGLNYPRGISNFRG